jgi:hypothetical protein
MKKTYHLKITNDGSDTTGEGTVDGKTVNWSSSGREFEICLDGTNLGWEEANEFQEWTEPFDLIEEELKEHELHPDDGYEARVCDGKILTLVCQNRVLIGTLLPAE